MSLQDKARKIEILYLMTVYKEKHVCILCISTQTFHCRNFGRSLEANDLLSGQSDELVEVKLDVLPPVASVPAVCLSRITRTP